MDVTQNGAFLPDVQPTGGPGVTALDFIGSSYSLSRSQGRVSINSTPLNFFVVTDKAYGAKGDGVTDDTAAIQAAINACSAAGAGVVFFPKGTYITTSSLSVPSFVTLMGVGSNKPAPEYGIALGQGSKIKCSTGSAFDLVVNSDSTNGNTGIEIRGLIFDCAGMTGDNRALVFNKVRRSFITDCFFRGAATASRVLFLYEGSSEHNEISFCFFEGGGIVGSSANRLVVDTCEFASGGIQLTSGFDHIIRDCDVYMTGQSAPYPWIVGIRFISCTGGLITGNQVTNCLQDGISLLRCLSVIVTANECKSNSTQSAGIWGGIMLDSDIVGGLCYRNVVVGNKSWDSVGAGGTQVGLRLRNTSSTTGQTKDNVIADNNLIGNRLNVAMQTDANLGVNYVHGNAGWDPRGSAVTQPAIAASGTAVTNTTQQDCTVFIVGGTVSAIAIGGTATGLTATPATVRVPSGQTITLTYTVAPTWQWFGD